jgi:membrane-bound metal-dependent hydrolase YbcI (DUF457 family)
MPSPLGHALGGAAVGLLAGRPQPLTWRVPAVLGLIACLPDLDLLTSQHSGITHSVGFAALAGLVVLAGSGNQRFAVAAMTAYGSHVLFDWLGHDTAAPYGVMALWPFGTGFHIAPWTPLPPVSRQYWLPGFWTHTMKVALVELMLFGGGFVLAWWHRSRRRSNG